MAPINPFLQRFPDQDLQEEFMNAVLREIITMEVHFSKKDYNDQRERAILNKYQLLITYVKKPSNAR